MASTVRTARGSAHLSSEPAQHKPRSRPIPLRVRTFSESGPWSPELDESHNDSHSRHKTTTTGLGLAQMSPSSIARNNGSREPQSSSEDVTAGASDVSTIITPPSSPPAVLRGTSEGRETDGPGPIAYDFSKIDYELERAKILGHGLWSTVYLAEPTPATPRQSSGISSTPPHTPKRHGAGSAPAFFAVKTATRRDAREVFIQEAKILSHLQRNVHCSQYVVPFYGLDNRNDALVFEAVLGGSLESLTGRLKHMTEVARHIELISIFPGIAHDLISGLEFLHSNGVVHADIKPGNVLLDISEHCLSSTHVIRARYIDLSAAFMQGDSASNAGGTWEQMSPEQMRIQKEFNTPTFASDVWSLGITLLTILVGGSPYTAACGGNKFLLREAVKSGDPMYFSSQDPVARKRLAACQDFVDCCRLALKKDREKRVTAAAWVEWFVEQQLGR